MNARLKAEAFLKIAHQFRLGELETEKPHPKTTELSTLVKDNLKKAIAILKEIDIEALQVVNRRAKEITGSIIIALALGFLFNLVWASFTIPFGDLSDKIGRKKVLLAGYLLFFFVSIGFIYLAGIASLVIFFLLYGLVYAITKANQTALVADLSDSMKGTALGFYQFVIGIASIAGGIIAGLLWDISYQTMFAYISVIALISLVLLIFVKE